MDMTPEGRSASMAEEVGPKDPILLPFRPPDRGGVAYRLIAEITQKRSITIEGSRSGGETIRESHVFELEYREVPMQGPDARKDNSILKLDGLHYRFQGGNPVTKREIELWHDRLRIRVDDETVIDLSGAARHQALHPRAMVGGIFGAIARDRNGNLVTMSPSGSPTARRLLADTPLWAVLTYMLFSFPTGPVAQGSQWTALRNPPGLAGELAAVLEIHYTLVAFDIQDDAPTAVIRLQAERHADRYQTPSGIFVDELTATLTGTASIDIETSRVRRMVLDDRFRITARSPGVSDSVIHSLIQQENRLTLELRDPSKKLRTWADGSRRLGSR